MVATRTGQRTKQVIVHVVIWVLCIIFAAPFFFTLSDSLRKIGGLLQLWPRTFHPMNYFLAVTMIPFGHELLISLFLAALSVFNGTLISAFVGFGFARLNGPGKNVYFIIVLATMMLPQVVTMIPTYILYSHFGFLNTYWPWVFGALVGNPFFIFLYKQFLAGIPKELEDAAKIDGCTTYGIFFKIFMPLSTPILVTAGVMSFQGAWNDPLTPWMYLSEKMYPLATALIGGFNAPNGQPSVSLTPVVEAATILLAVPIIITFFIGQKNLIELNVSAGLKD